MSVTTICDDCRKDITGEETFCGDCIGAKDTEISELQDKLKDAESERDDFASQLEDMRREKSE